MQPLIGIVGPCAAGKSTLADRLKSLGYRAKVIAQEHSYVPDMWRRLTKPDLLIYLDVSYPVSMQRRKMDWTSQEFDVQVHRLESSRLAANLTIDTDPLTIEEVVEKAKSFLNKQSD